ncbi:hypothetical protein LTR10_021687 [Elasticomyces elasticus]|uniref:Uncharacterized protein n=1 Tax=Exophiala sideris TaxID=1016849 RepID=A0ABR0IUS2_9EURO|nr:hypothetical protein LTR10_021687 [Elasticomyces elasticus]KAK5021132.1 hypothetical protein LTS07_011219 [Exophiala sideris]KAK5023743.1 hypothetical protein LTR13_011121 [Exophiala sideris]KAK5048822.1 hypothetical protein LTR69_011236 [Exophiala sideris]KAK5176317.1 hypothetical protein LTR44_011148 [Eurotiomycetes sp. CCFEE 6388]
MLCALIKVQTDFYPIQQLRLGKLPLPNLFSTRNDELHANMKRPVAHIYSMSSMVTFEPYVDHCSKLFFSRLDELYVSTGDDCDLGEWLQWYAMDVIAELTFGKMFGCLAVGGDVGDLIKTLAQFEQYAAVIGQVPYLHKLLLGNPILPYLVPKLEDINQVLKFSLDRIRERNSDKESRHEDFLSKLYTAKADGKMSEADTVRHSSANVFAGSDTTAVALRATIDGLLLRPECYRKLQAEIDRKREQGELSSPVKYSEAQQMPYLQAVLKEAMRWHPSVAMLLERHVPKGGTILCGIPIPANTIVGVNPWVVQRDRTIFGDDAHVFRPERWLEADTERFKIMDRAFLAFGGGSHTCIGRNISMMEMSKIIPSLLLEYDITRADPNARIRTVNYWFAVQKGLVVKLAKRKSLPQGPA